MGCFLACLGGPKDRKRRRSPKKSPPRDRRHESYKLLQQNASPLRAQPLLEQITPQLSLEKPSTEVAANSTPDQEIREINEQGSFSSCRKKVTFDLNVKTYEEAATQGDEKCISEEDEENEAREEEKNPQEDAGKPTSQSGNYPLNHRYQNCSNSDDEDGGDGEEDGDGEDDDEDEYGEEDEDEDYDDCGIDKERNPIGLQEDEESYESFFSLPIEKELENNQEVISPGPKCVSSPDKQPILLAKGNPRDRSHYINSVLNPVENLSQWKEVKVGAVPLKNTNKENINLEQEKNKMVLSPEPTFKTKKLEGTADSNNSPCKQEVSVDASLSTWLVSSENSSVQRIQESNSARSNWSLSREERPILGALTVEDIKQSSVTSSPRRSPSRSPDEIPIVGTVGSYWSCRSQGDTSSYSSRSGSVTKGIPRYQRQI
uniref:Uncharacterized protein n=1 Tax=Ananas comosus var. bracteatus TaxID=296719 RepID=A0A6V7PZK5_ANACO|nr:unnamed protein product [Ananas comosus var. bracteatus]